MTRLGLAQAFGVFAAGCSDGTHVLGGVIDQSVSPTSLVIGKCADGADLELIDDMEDADGTIALAQGRSGVWFSYNDRTNGEQTPPFPTRVFAMEALDPPRGASKRAAHTTGAGFTGWGAGMGCTLSSQHPYDATRYSGLAFWARSPGGTNAELRLGVPDQQTNPFGGICEDNHACDNDFGAAIPLSDEWQFHVATWDKLRQQQWAGQVLFTAIESRAIYQVQFQVPGNQPFDYWVDDLALICAD